MSYILDAIKKSDQQRDIGTIPDVHTIHEPPEPEPPRRPGWLYGLATILLLNAGVIGWWLLWPGATAKVSVAKAPETSVVAKVLPKTPPPPAPPQPIKTESPPAQATSVPPVPPPPQQVAMSPAPAAVAPQAVLAEVPKPPSATTPPPPPLPTTAQAVAINGNGGATLSTIPVPAAPPQASKSEPPASPPANKAKTVTASNKNAATSRKLEAPAAQTPAGAVVPVQMPSEPAVSREEPLAETEVPPATDVESNTEAMASEAALAPIASTVAPKTKAKRKDREDEDPELSKIPLLDQLPPEIQQTIPELHISFHSYSIKSSARLVSIGGKILHEGEPFDGDVKLETITTQGVVMTIKDRRFRLKVNPSSRL
jgi:general secretion pathway protein B